MKTAIPYYPLLSLLIILCSSCSGCEKGAHAVHSQPETALDYTCPMHPEIIRHAPGKCPICSMDLQVKGTVSNTAPDGQLNELLRPSNEFVISEIAVTTIANRKENLELMVTGKIGYDTRQVGAISSRLTGRIEKLYVRYKFQPVKKGQRILDIYSPELVTAQQNLIFTLENDATNSSLIAAAKNRLLVLGMKANQISEIIRTRTPMYVLPVFSNYDGYVTDKIESANNSGSGAMPPLQDNNQALNIKEGMYVESGQTLLTVYNPARAWILLDIFPDQQALVKIGNLVHVVPEIRPDEKMTARIDYIEPVYRTGSKTLTARVYFNNARLELPIGSRVTATIFVSTDEASWLPKEAVVSTGRDKIVFKKASGGFITHKVVTGIESADAIQIISGLSETDSVAANAHFLIDNEAFINVPVK